jgi:hypothetical protein
MQNIIFWNDWEKPYKIAINLLAVVFILSVSFLITGILWGESFVIDWQVLNIKQPLAVTFDSFTKGFFNFNIVAENFVVFQKFQGSELQVNLPGSYIFGLFIAISIVFYLSAVTELSRFWYIVAMGVFIIFMVNLKLEHLQIFGRIDRIPLIIVFLILLPTSYYFHAMNKESLYWKRLLVFAVLVTACCFGFYLFAGVEHPFLYLTNYGILGVLIITAAFILMISHEIINAFIYLLTSSTTLVSRNTLRHFLVITAFYLGNIMMLYLHETRVIDWEFYYINPYILLILSSTIGFWGLITRSEILKNAVPFYPWGPMLYLSVAIIATATTGYLFVTGNDPVLEVIEDVIIYGHLGFGFFFFIYILANFGALFGKKTGIYKVIYKPTNMPYFTFRFAGLIAVAALFLKENFEVPIYHSLSGYYNGIGDLYTATREYYLAEQYYKLGSDYGYQNHRSNYALASLASKQGNDVTAIYFYEQAIKKRPTEYAYINVSNTLMANGQFLNGLFALRDGLDQFPKSGPLMVNAGLAFLQTEILDSAAILFDQATAFKISERLGKNNLLAMVAENNWQLDPDSLRESYYLKGNEISEINYSTLLNQNQKTGNYVPQFPSDSILGLVSSSQLINFGMNSFIQGDDAFIAVMDSLSNKPENSRYSDEIQYILALGMLKNNRIDKSISILKSLAANNLLKAGFYYNTIGLIAMRNNAWDVAAKYFDYAFQSQLSGSLLNKSVALTEDGNLEEARESWKLLQKINGRETVATAMLQILDTPKDSLMFFDDRIKYQFLRYREDELSSEERRDALLSFENQAYPERLTLDRAWELFQNMKFMEAQNELANLTVTNDSWKEEYKLLSKAVEVSLRHGSITEVDISLFNSNIKGELPSLKRYLRSVHAEEMNDTVSASAEYELLGFGNPFFVPGIIRAVNYFSKNHPDEFTSYSLLVEAVQYNNRSELLWENYVKECLKRGFDNYAGQGMVVLKELLNARDYTIMEANYSRWKQEFK